MIKIETIEEPITDAIFIIKPDGLSKDIGKYSLKTIVETSFLSTGLEIVDMCSRQLTDKEVREIYPIMEKPDLVYGEGWKGRLITHVSSAPIVAYHLRGKDAQRKASIIKTSLRKALCDQTSEQGVVIANIAHVPEQENFDATYNAVFRKNVS